MGYTPNSRRRSDSELAELRDGAKNLRARARRSQQAGDPVQAERYFRHAEMNEAEIQAEVKQRR